MRKSALALPVARSMTFLVALCLLATSAFAASYVVPHDDVFIAKSDAIVIARAIRSHAEESAEYGIETVTDFAVEDVLKGSTTLASGIRIRTLGGVIRDGESWRMKMVAGAPRFLDGERVLLFATKRKDDSGDFATTDFALGLFSFSTDETGHHLLSRAETDIFGWDPDGKLHEEQARDSEKFIEYIRGIVAHRSPAMNYSIPAKPLLGQPKASTSNRLTPVTETCAGCTKTQYTLTFYAPGSAPCNIGTAAAQLACAEAGPGGRWNTFPSAVNWNRGNTEANAGNGGSDAINLANSSWDGDTSSNVNYALTSTTANSNGIQEAPDGINNVVFEKDLTIAADYICASGGVLGLGGVNNASSTHTLGGESFFTNLEGDVSMNKGVGACIGGLLSVSNFNSAVTHELGHTLGFRHADKSREGSQTCASQVNYDCASSAIMTAVVTQNLNGALQAWDQAAVAAVYPGAAALPAPTGVVATAATTTSVGISWNSVVGATTYEVHRSSDNATFTQITACNTASLSCTDTTAAAGVAYLYKVRAGTTGTFSTADLATTLIFTDPTLTAQSTPIRAAHITELRTAVNAVRKLANGGVANNFAFTDPTITTQSTQVKRIHIIDLRSALDAARATLTLSTLTYTDPTITAQSTVAKTLHITELRGGVQ